ncbi:MAG: hypothetical protein A2201_05770 [Alicyclobacillus sp. RIFOXYA1_FULL_53_8]|nr:MAG: hypothetical protein A2201_05770 [Alicyclobacillus sp. RIFOXYA1_FULL_53_8]
MRSFTGHQVLRRLQHGEPIRVIDVREPNEFAAGHIPGAELIPIGEIPTVIYRLRTDEEVVFVCRSGARSQRVCEFLASKGFSQVATLKGGMLQWPGRVERSIGSAN